MILQEIHKINQNLETLTEVRKAGVNIFYCHACIYRLNPPFNEIVCCDKSHWQLICKQSLLIVICNMNSGAGSECKQA